MCVVSFKIILLFFSSDLANPSAFEGVMASKESWPQSWAFNSISAVGKAEVYVAFSWHWELRVCEINSLGY